MITARNYLFSAKPKHDVSLMLVGSFDVSRNLRGSPRGTAKAAGIFRSAFPSCNTIRPVGKPRMVSRFSRALSFVVQFMLGLSGVVRSLRSVVSRVARGRQRSVSRQSRVVPVPLWLAPLGLLGLKPALAPAAAPARHRESRFGPGDCARRFDCARHHR